MLRTQVGQALLLVLIVAPEIRNLRHLALTVIIQLLLLLVFSLAFHITL